MPSDAALAIVSTASVGLAAVGASAWGVLKTTSAQDRRERQAVKRDVYAHFWELQRRALTACEFFRVQQGKATQDKALQLLQDLVEAEASVDLTGGAKMRTLAEKLVDVLFNFHEASLTGLLPEDRGDYRRASRDLLSAMRADLGEPEDEDAWRKEPRGLMWPAG
jgi:hypothetical protein